MVSVRIDRSALREYTSQSVLQGYTREQCHPSISSSIIEDSLIKLFHIIIIILDDEQSGSL
jgi:hypothetical protein